MLGCKVPQLSKDDLEELLHCKVACFASSMLTPPGENYGSTMLSVDVTLLSDHRKLPLVAKMLPASLHMREAFDTDKTVRKEIYAYLLVRPELLSIQEEYQVPGDLFLDVIPKCYGARTTRVGDIGLPVDDSAAILLENLKASGYRLLDRIVDMDMKHTEYVVIRLARFHATTIAIKLKKSQVFEDFLSKAAVYVKHPLLPGDKSLLDTVDSSSDVPVIAENKEKLKALIQKDLEEREIPGAQKPNERFATLVHTDLWTNNMMFSYDRSDGKIIRDLKFLDFQLTSYGSPASDLLFFLFSSTDLSMTKDKCDELTLLYHKELKKCLELFGCYTKSFSYENFLKEVKTVAPTEFCHVLYMLRAICMSRSNVPDITKLSECGRFYVDNSGYGDIYFKKTERLVQEFLDRNWI